MKFVPAFRAKGAKLFPNTLWGVLTAQGSVSSRGDLVEHVGKPLREGRHLVALVGDEVDLLRARCDRVRALPQHVAADLDARERHGPVGVGRVDDLELEIPVGRQILECALEVERLERAVRVLGSRSAAPPGAMLSQSPSIACFDLRDVCFHAACPSVG